MSVTLDVACRTWVPAWREAASLPDGPVDLWLVMFSDDQRLLGAGPVTEPVTWRWRGGALCCGYGDVRMTALQSGVMDRYLIVAVSQATGQYVPVFSIPVLQRERIRRGNTMTVTDGDITFLEIVNP